MIKRTKLKKSKFFIAALTMLSIMSANSFSASKKSSQQKQQHTEWKQITLEPDLDGDGIKDKIDVDYAVEGDNVHLQFTPYIFGKKAKFVKGKTVEKTISKSEFESKFDTFIKGFIAEYPKVGGSTTPKQNVENNTENKQNITQQPNAKINEANKNPASQKKKYRQF